MRWGLIVLFASMFAGTGRAEAPLNNVGEASLLRQREQRSKDTSPTLRNDELIAKLIVGLDDTDGEVRQNLAAALANLGDPAVPSLIEALGHSKKERRIGAAIALGRIRPAAHAAIPALLNAMKDKEEPVRREVSYALSRIVGKEAPASNEKSVMPPLDPTPGSPNSGVPR